ncbi:hypothetical protein [Candidatus Symbiothrix dinenymphae]|uniref:hypothetical protein n=1 Tax=Candidatus Symbiothrix dinenymphae TaxID=467085 RepID=UPI00131595E5|nr:hypothetical protein [Candidatus Symbiothrix dinenymphae]
MSDSEIEEKVKRLAEDVKLINQYKDTNKLYTNYSEIYPQVFYANYTVEKFICNPQELKQNGIDRDVINSLQNILQMSEETIKTSTEVKDELLSWINKDNCHGLIAFHKISGFDDSVQIIYGMDGWYKFRRHFLGLSPKDANYFIDECIKYFPLLYFREENKDAIKSILKECPKKIIYHLSALNDKFKDCVTPELKGHKSWSNSAFMQNLTKQPHLKAMQKEKRILLFLLRTNQEYLKMCAVNPT